MPQRISPIKELQDSEWLRFQTVSEIYRESTRNPVGLRFSNIETAFNIVAASKHCGWPSGFEKQSFFKSVADVLEDYILGSYIDDLKPPYRLEFNEPQLSEAWFDFVQLGLYLSLFGEMETTTRKIAKWVRPGMKVDPGIEEVSPFVNFIYEFVCSSIRGEAPESACLMAANASRPSVGDMLLGEMATGIANKDSEVFLGALARFGSAWQRKAECPSLNEMFAVDASVLCGSWRFLTGKKIPSEYAFDCIYMPESLLI